MRKLQSAVGVLLVVLLLFLSADAAVTPNAPIFVQTPKFPHLQLTNANGTTAQTLYACGTNGSKITAMWATSTDTAARDIRISVLNTSTYVQTTVTVPLSSGNVAGAPAVNLMSPTNWPGLPIDSDGNPYFLCASGDTLQAAAVTTITTALFVNILLTAADF